MLNKLLIAFDGSEHSYKTFDFALEMSRLCGSSPEITVLAVVQPPESTGNGKTDDVVDSAAKLYEHLFKGLRDKAQRKNLEIRTDVVTGQPAHEIVKYASEKNSDMIIVGQRGKSTMANLLLGSVSKKIAAHSPCTVTIVK